MLEAIFIFFLMTSAIAAFYFITRNTYLRLDIKSGNIWPIQLYREFIMVTSGVLLPLVYGVGSFEDAILNARDEDIFNIALLSVYAIFGFGITLALLAKRFRIPSGRDQIRLVMDDYRVQRFANAALAAGLLLLSIAFIFLSYKHAFITSILTGENLVSVRLQNSYDSHLPSQIAQIISSSWWVVSIYAGILVFKKQKLKSAFYILSALFLASAAGDKAPVMMCFMLMSFSYFSVRAVRISWRTVSKTLFLFVPLLYVLVYFVVSLQSTEFSIEKFNIYLLNRIGVGQMGGVFETFSIPRVGGEFYWHMIPGASFFVDYIPYDKMLMMVTEGYGYTQMGVKNSLFISEAYGIGGVPLVIFSPMIVGCCYALGVYILYLFLKAFFGRAVSVIYTLPLYVLSSALTGGFSSFPFFKGLLLEILCLGVVWIVFQIFRISPRKSSNRKYAYIEPHHVPRPIPGSFPRPANPQVASSTHSSAGPGPQL